MKFFFKEYNPDYKSYLFPYEVFLYKEEDDKLEDIYNLGFLPSRKEENLFYLSRNLRIDISKFSLTSENRRILRKTEYIKSEIHSLSEFEYHYSIGKLAKDFYDKRSGKKTFSANKIKWLFSKEVCSHVFTYLDKRQEKIFGYSLVNKTRSLLHYAYPFYDIEYVKNNAGMGMMLRSIIWAKDNDINHVYLGTCYTEKSLYKLQFKGIEFFDGKEWNDNTELLKDIVKKYI